MDWKPVFHTVSTALPNVMTTRYHLSGPCCGLRILLCDHYCTCMLGGSTDGCQHAVPLLRANSCIVVQPSHGNTVSICATMGAPTSSVYARGKSSSLSALCSSADSTRVPSLQMKAPSTRAQAASKTRNFECSRPAKGNHHTLFAADLGPDTVLSVNSCRLSAVRPAG